MNERHEQLVELDGLVIKSLVSKLKAPDTDIKTIQAAIKYLDINDITSSKLTVKKDMNKVTVIPRLTTEELKVC